MHGERAAYEKENGRASGEVSHCSVKVLGKGFGKNRKSWVGSESCKIEAGGQRWKSRQGGSSTEST